MKSSLACHTGNPAAGGAQQGGVPRVEYRRAEQWRACRQQHACGVPLPARPGCTMLPPAPPAPCSTHPCGLPGSGGSAGCRCGHCRGLHWGRRRRAAPPSAGSPRRRLPPAGHTRPVCVSAPCCVTRCPELAGAGLLGRHALIGLADGGGRPGARRAEGACETTRRLEAAQAVPQTPPTCKNVGDAALCVMAALAVPTAREGHSPGEYGGLGWL